MKLKKKFNKRLRLGILALMLVLFMASIPLCHADSGIDLQAIPDQVATQLNVSPFVAGLIVSLIFMAAFLFPSIIIAGHYGGSGAAIYTIIFMGLGSSGVCVALGWFPVWLYAIACLLIAGLFGGKYAKFGEGEKS